MGLLDDAIREHLDLKRRRGADPGEVERAEREALGPVRRNPTPSELAEAEAAAEPADLPAYDQAEQEDWSHDSLQETAADGGVEPVYDEPPAEPVAGPPEFYDEDPAHEPLPEPPAPRPAMSAGPETAEYDVEDALAAEEQRDPSDDGEDVLEETPEFLQDTPDHDRLWFEQRPPKDFDFDE
jgi:hypothetical protein